MQVDEAPGSATRFNIMAGLASAGALETAYLTYVSEGGHVADGGLRVGAGGRGGDKWGRRGRWRR